MKSSKNTFSKNLKLLREKRFSSQQLAADAIKVGRSTYTKWESGEALPDFTNLDSLSRVFDVPFDAFFSDQGPVRPSVWESLSAINEELGFKPPEPLEIPRESRQSWATFWKIPTDVLAKLVGIKDWEQILAILPDPPHPESLKKKNSPTLINGQESKDDE